MCIRDRMRTRPGGESGSVVAVRSSGSEPEAHTLRSAREKRRADFLWVQRVSEVVDDVLAGRLDPGHVQLANLAWRIQADVQAAGIRPDRSAGDAVDISYRQPFAVHGDLGLAPRGVTKNKGEPHE